MINKMQNNQYTQVDDNTKRAILNYTPQLMTVKILCDHLTETVELHHHPEEQSTYILKGKFKFFIDKEAYILEAGDSIFFEANVPHGCLVLEPHSELLDTFTPMRSDFL